MSWARASSRSFLTGATVEAQRGRTPQLVFMRSRIRSAVVLGSTVAGLSSGTGGGFTVVHSLVMSMAGAGTAASAVATAASRAMPQDGVARFLMMFPPFKIIRQRTQTDQPCPPV